MLMRLKMNSEIEIWIENRIEQIIDDQIKEAKLTNNAKKRLLNKIIHKDTKTLSGIHKAKRYGNVEKQSLKAGNNKVIAKVGTTSSQ